METNKTEKKLTDRQTKTIPCLLACSTTTAAAKQAGVSLIQIYEWMKEPTFKRELENQRAQILEGAINRLKYGMRGFRRDLFTFSSRLDKMEQGVALGKMITIFFEQFICQRFDLLL